MSCAKVGLEGYNSSSPGEKLREEAERKTVSITI